MFICMPILCHCIPQVTWNLRGGGASGGHELKSLQSSDLGQSFPKFYLVYFSLTWWVWPYEPRIGPGSLCSSVFRMIGPSSPGAVELACRGTLIAERPSCLEEPRPFLPPLTSEKSWSVTLVSSHLALNHCRACLKHTPGPHTLSCTGVASMGPLVAVLQWRATTDLREGSEVRRKEGGWGAHTAHSFEPGWQTTEVPPQISVILVGSLSPNQGYRNKLSVCLGPEMEFDFLSF